jgi:hypothetical protein
MPRITIKVGACERLEPAISKATPLGALGTEALVWIGATCISVGGREGTRLRRVLLRWQAPQPCRSRPGATVAEAVDPYASRYASPYASPYAGHPRTPLAGRAICSPWSCPLVGLVGRKKPRPTGPPRGEWSGRAEWCASRD